MSFNSYIYILVFLPIAVVGYRLVHQRSCRAGVLYLIGASLVFYSWGNIRFLPFILASIAVNYFFIRIIRRWHCRWMLVCAIAVNILFLGYCKYANFFLSSVSSLLHKDFVERNILIPLGVSFYTFQQISYLVDTWRGETEKESFLDYALYILYFPKIISGPLVPHEVLIPQFYKKNRNRQEFLTDICRNSYRFILGLSKKVLLADLLGNAVNWGFSNVDALTAADTWIVMTAYTFQLYLDFSGYSDMAIAASGMLGITLPENFDSPYQSLSIPDFWKRWHITLTDFLRKYIYFPLGGSRGGRVKTILNILIVFLVSGFWHGANWTFVLWGLLHGVLSAGYRICHKGFDQLNIVFRWTVNFILVEFLWLLFRANSVGMWLSLSKRAVKMEDMHITDDLVSHFRPVEGIVLEKLPVLGSGINHLPLFWMSAVLLLCFFGTLNVPNTGHMHYKYTFLSLIGCTVLLVLCLLSFGTVSTYIYAGF